MSDDRFGSAPDRLIVCGPGAAKAAGSKAIVSAPAAALAFVIASRKVHSVASHTPSPGSFVELTTKGGRFGSQASPAPSPSASAWSGFGTFGQLSAASGTPSPSASGCGGV